MILSVFQGEQMKHGLSLTVLSAVLLFTSAYGKEKLAPEVTPVFKLTSQVKKDIYDNKESDNIDDFYGRVTFGMNAALKNFEGSLAIRAYPTGFGYELMRGLQTAEDTVGVDPVFSKIAKFQIIAASVTHKGDLASITIGRNTLFNSNGMNYGNYVDEGPGGGFSGKGVSANFINISWAYNIGKSCFTVGSSDSKLNTGYLRFFQDFTVFQDGHIGLGVRTDLPNEVYSPDSTVHWNATAIFDYTIKDKVNLYLETGFFNMSKDVAPLIPVLAGVKVPLLPVFSAISFEMEYLEEIDREVIGIGDDMERVSSVLLALNLERDLNEHFGFLAGLYTQREISEMGIGLKLKIAL